MTQNYLGKLKSYFQSNRRGCPECGADIAKSARICPECGHNFLAEEETKPSLLHFKYNTENCCSVFLIILILIAGFFLVFPYFREFLFAIGAVLIVVGIAVALFLAYLFYRISKIFRF